MAALALALASFRSEYSKLQQIKTFEMFYGDACNMTYMSDYCETSRVMRPLQVMRNSFKLTKYFSDEVAFIILPGQLPIRKYFFRKCRCIMGNEVQSKCLSRP